MLQTLAIDADVVENEVITNEMAVCRRFFGSPTVQINRVDIDPDASGRDDYDLSCRLYQIPEGGLVPYRMIASWQPLPGQHDHSDNEFTAQ